MSKRLKEADRSQLDLELGRGEANRPRTHAGIELLDLGAKFVAFYGYDEEKVETVEVCGLCHGEAFRRDNFKNATIRLLAQVTARR